MAGGLALGKLERPTMRQVADVPWWAWGGGFFSVLLIMAQFYASPAIGAATFLGIVASLPLDHYGLVGFPVHPASLRRITGAALMVAGVTLVAVF